MGDARGRSRIPHKTPTAQRGRICRGTPPCGVLERFLLNLQCFISPARSSAPTPLALVSTFASSRKDLLRRALAARVDEAEALVARAAEAETAGEVASARADAPAHSRPRHVTREHGAPGLTHLMSFPRAYYEGTTRNRP